MKEKMFARVRLCSLKFAYVRLFAKKVKLALKSIGRPNTPQKCLVAVSVGRVMLVSCQVLVLYVKLLTCPSALVMKATR